MYKNYDTFKKKCAALKMILIYALKHIALTFTLVLLKLAKMSNQSP